MQKCHGWASVLLVLTVLVFTENAWAKQKRYIIKRLGTSFEESSQARARVMGVRSEGVFQREVLALSQSELEELKSDASVMTVEEDFIMRTAQTPSDPEYFSQWHYHDALGGINLPSAWDQTTGSSSVVVAVLDTGIVNHPELAGRVLPGADLISDPTFANDGGGRDGDATDAGDWINPGDPCYQGQSQASTWHGTHVAGTIGANANDSQGVVGINWKSKILPVRVLGKCGGYTSDIADGIRWAVGGNVSGVAANKNPARVINMSLGGEGPCTSDMQSAIDFARSKKAVIVVAAGNSSANLDVTGFAPANCRGVIVVGANNRNGVMAYYSNYGEMVDITAPGGDLTGGVISLTDYSSTTPSSQYGTKAMNGTSMAAPHVSGVLSLMLSVNSGLFPDQLAVILKQSSRAFGWSSNCDEARCGAGILDADEAVYQASQATPDASVSDLEPINAGPSADEDRVVTHQSGGGGFCGSVDFGGGPGGGGGMMMLSLFLMIATVMARRFQGAGAKNKTAPEGLLPARVSMMFCALKSSIASLVSWSALPIWGVSVTFESLKSSLSRLKGSLANTSRPAPMMRSSLSA